MQYPAFETYLKNQRQQARKRVFAILAIIALAGFFVSQSFNIAGVLACFNSSGQENSAEGQTSGNGYNDTSGLLDFILHSDNNQGNHEQGDSSDYNEKDKNNGDNCDGNDNSQHNSNNCGNHEDGCGCGSPSLSPSPSKSPCPSPSETPSPSPCPSQTPSPSPTPSENPCPSETPSQSPSPSETPSPSPTPSETPSPSPLPSESPSPSPSPSPSETPSPSPSPSESPSPSPSPTIIPVLTSGGGGGVALGNGPLPPSNAYANWLAQSASQQTPPGLVVQAPTPSPVPQGEVKGATTLPSTGFDLTEALALITIFLAAGTVLLIAKRELKLNKSKCLK